MPHSEISSSYIHHRQLVSPMFLTTFGSMQQIRVAKYPSKQCRKNFSLTGGGEIGAPAFKDATTTAFTTNNIQDS